MPKKKKPKKKPYGKIINFRTSAEIHARLKKRARMEATSVSKLLRQIVEKAA